MVDIGIAVKGSLPQSHLPEFSFSSIGEHVVSWLKIDIHTYPYIPINRFFPNEAGNPDRLWISRDLFPYHYPYQKAFIKHPIIDHAVETFISA